MNLELLESFGQNFPEDFDGTLDCMSVAITCQFNRHGTLLAVGCNDGRIFIWDFLTRGIAKIINAHVYPVCSLSWSRSGYQLLSASTDNSVCVWCVVSGDCLRKYRFPSAFLKVQYHPRNDSVFLVSLLKHPSLLVFADGSYRQLPLDDPAEPNVISSFDKRGDHVYCGNAKGKVSVLNTHTLELVTSFKVTNSSASSSVIRQIEFARRGSSFLVSTSDRIIRVYDTNDVFPKPSAAASAATTAPSSSASSAHGAKAARSNGNDPEPLQKLQDLVNRTLWKKCCFSGDGEFICAGSSRQHSLYIWEKSVGNLVKILHGTKGEMLMDVVWHPIRPLIASVSSGIVSIWSQNQVENWSAFAPDFKELDENVEYEERESEYDLDDEDKSVRNEVGNDDDVDVDVISVQPMQAFLSSDEECESDQLLFLTISPEFDEVEENPAAPATASSVPATTSTTATSGTATTSQPAQPQQQEKRQSKSALVATKSSESAAAMRSNAASSSIQTSKSSTAAVVYDIDLEKKMAAAAASEPASSSMSSSSSSS